MNVLSILKANLVGTTISVFKTSDGKWHKYAAGEGQWIDCTITDVVFKDAVVYWCDRDMEDPYYNVILDCGYEMELDLN